MNGSRWQLQAAAKAAGPLASVSCSSTTACTAVGGFEHFVGPLDTAVYDSVIERFDGSSWERQPVPAPSAATGSGLLSVSCETASSCEAVGSAQYAGTSDGQSTTGNDEAIVGGWQAGQWSAQALSFPAALYGSAPAPPVPRDWLYSISCASSRSCEAVGQYVASNGDIGPLAAGFNGSQWTQTVLRRGPVGLTSVSCPRATWCMAVGPVAERFS